MFRFLKRSAIPAALATTLALLLSACNSPRQETPAAIPALTSTPEAAAVEGEVIATVAASEQPADSATVALPTPTPEPAAAAASTPAPAVAPTVSQARTELLVSGLVQPIGLVHAGDGTGRLFAIEKAGLLRVVEGGVVAETPFLDLTDRVESSASEQGLLGLAFAPDFAATGRFYVNYTNRDGNTVISRLRTTTGNGTGAGDAASEEILLSIQQPARNHNGGNLVFGPDGFLWIGTGDGGSANDRFGNGQNPATLLGKMLRIDVSPATGYAIPADNPWIETTWNGQEVADEIWAVGLRNPWRYSFDRATGDLWIADVGQNEWEEVNRVPAGSLGALNFGWPIQEGTHCFTAETCDTTGLEQPVLEYRHEGHCSITGGFVYRGVSYPAAQGAYIYGDYCSGFVWAGLPQADGTWRAVELLRAGVPIPAIAEDEAGELYLVDYNGAIHRLIFG